MTKSAMHSVKGIANWAKVFDFNRDKGSFYEDCDGACTIDVLLDQEELAKLAESGSRLKPKVTEDGISVKFKRKFKHPSIPALGGAPKVVDSEDNVWDTEVSIGNGSEAEVFFTVYDTKFGKGTRLEGVRITNLVEYERPEGEETSDMRLPF